MRDAGEVASRKAHVRLVTERTRDILEDENLLALTVNLKQGLPAVVEVAARIDGRLTGASRSASGRMEMARELGLALIAAEKTDTNGRIVVDIENGSMRSELVTGPRDDWRVPSLEIDTQPATAAH